MYSKYDGLVFMIDTGMSRGVQSGRGAAADRANQQTSISNGAVLRRGHRIALAVSNNVHRFIAERPIRERRS